MNLLKSNFIPAGLRAGLASLLLIGVAANSRAEGTSTLNATDAAGSSSFNSNLHWNGGVAPGPGTNFFTSTFSLRSPAAAGNYTFLGDSLTINSGGGALAIKGGNGNIVTINNLTNSGLISDAINANQNATIAGNMVVVGGATFNTSTASGDVRNITNNMIMSGTGAMTNTTTTAGNFPGAVIYTANNSAFTGPLIVQSNQTVQAGALNNLGGNPASFNAAQLLLNNGTLLPTAGFTMNNANSGVTLGTNGGTFNVGSGITFTVANPITGPGSLTKSGAGTLILTSANTYTNGTLVSGGILNVQNSFGLGSTGTVNEATGNRTSSIQLQGNLSLPSSVKFITSNDGTVGGVTNAIQNISGDNTINGTVTLTLGGGGTAIQSDSGALVLAGNITIAAGQTSRGIILQGVSTAANTVSGNVSDLSPTSVDSVTKNGNGTWTLTGTNTYTGSTAVNGGTLILSGGGSISNTALISVAAGAILDVSGLTSTFVLNSGQSLSNSVGIVNGSVAAVAGSSIYPATVGVAGTLTFNNNLNLNAGGTVNFDLNTIASSGNDQIVVGGNLTLSSSDTIHINAQGGAAPLDQTADYVLFAVSGTTTMTTTPNLVWDGTQPANTANYSLKASGNNVVLSYSASTGPTITSATASPNPAFRNQAVTITANVTRGTFTVTNVTVDLSPIGGSSTAGLVLNGAGSSDPNFVYTNTFLVAASTTLGDKSLTVLATDNNSPTPLTGSFTITPVTMTADAVTWDGGAADDQWTSNANWAGATGPGFIGDSVTFAGTTRLTPDMNTNYTTTSLTFDVTAGAFTIGSSTGSTLTSGSGGITNNSSSAETLNVPIVNIAAQTFIAAAGNLTLNSNLSLAGNTLTVDGVANTTIAGVVSGTAGIQKNGGGTLLLSGVNTYGNNGASDTSINVGSLAVGNDLALGTSRLNFGDGGILQSADSSAHLITNRLNFGSGAGGHVTFGGTGNLKLTGSANNGTDKILTVNNPQTELSGAMTGASGRTVAGTGILILSAANTYSTFTTINSGATLQLGNGGLTGSLATSSTIDDEGTLTFNRSNAVVQGVDFTGTPITGAGGIVQAGSGTTTLNAANTYSGAMTANNGELFITPAYQSGGNVSVAGGAKFGISANSVTNSAAIGSLTLGVGATTLDFSYNFAGNPTNAALAAGAVTINGTATIRIGGGFAVGAFPVLKYTSLTGTFAGGVAGPRGVTATLSNDVVNQVLYVVVSSIGSGIVWTGTNSVSPNLWDLNTTTNWIIGGQPTVYIETVPPGDAVTFNDLGSGTVLLSNTASPANVTISNTAVNYTFQGTGQINSAGGLNKVGAGSVTLNVPGNYTGSTVLSNGAVNLGASQTFANLSGNSAVTGTSGSPTLTANNSLNLTFVGNISGALSLAKTSAGVLTMPGSNTFSGNLFVSGGGVTLNSGSINAGNFCSIGHLGTDNGTLTLKGPASFITSSDFNVGDVGASVGTFNIQDTASLTANAVYIGSANAASSTASGTVNQTNGTVTELSTTAGTFSIGGRASGTSVGGVGTYNLSGGTVTSASAIRVGAVGMGTFEQSSGTVNANAGVDIATIAGAIGTYNLDGGTLRTLNIVSSSAGNATMNFNGGLLTPIGSSLSFMTNIALVNVRNGGVVMDTAGFSVTVSPLLQHSTIGGDNAIDGGLTKLGAGTLTLNGVGSTYTGPTAVLGGGLNLYASSVPSLNNLTVNNAALGLGLAGGTVSFAATSLTLTGNTTLNFNYDQIAGTPMTALNVSSPLTLSGTATINVSGYGWAPGQYSLVTYTGAPLPDLSHFALANLPSGMTASLSNNTANLSIDLVVTAVGITTWIPLAATDLLGTSSFAAAGNWQSGVAPTAGNGYFTLAFAIRSPADTNAYSFGGSALSIDPGGRFLMKGTNGQAMTINNLIMNGGLVDYANAGDNFVETLGGNITLQGGLTSYLGALSAGGSETLYVTAPIGGSGNLQIGGSTINGGQDTGDVVLAGTNTYTGTTTVATGVLLLNGANGNSAITVATNGTLGGAGTIGGTINVQAGGKLAPGTAARGALTNVIGTLTSSSAASISGAVAMKINRDVSPNSDKFAAPAITVNSGATLTVANLSSSSLAAGDTFTLFSTPVSGAFSSVTLPALPGSNLYWTNNVAVNGTISVVSTVTVNTNPTNVTASVSGNVLTLSWPADHLGWHLQVQTNSLSNGLGANWVTIPGSDTVTSTNITIRPDIGSVFYRMVYP